MPRKYTVALASAAAALAFTAGAAQAATILDVSAASNAGITRFLDAGTYSFTFTNSASGGSYDAWNAWSDVSGCNAQGSNCTHGWIVSLALDLGNATGAFDRTNGLYYAQASTSDSLRYSTAADANAEADTALYRVGSLTSGGSSLTYPPLTFSLATAQNVNFFISDPYYADNSGGVSIALNNVSSAVPEPYTWALMLVGFGAMGIVSRGKKKPLSVEFARVPK